MEDTPERVGQAVRATFTGTGTSRILLIAHMDTVYLKGMAEKQPFRVEGDKAFGLAIADDKQGIAVILHTLAMLNSLGMRDYGTLTVLINGDEEISSPGSRKLLSRLGAEHDVTMSFEASRAESDKVSLATAGIGSVTLRVTGKASHAGSAPHLGVNALYELAHQILQTRDLSQPDIGLKLNWTLAEAGQNRNVIPPEAEAQADVRVLRVADPTRSPSMPRLSTKSLARSLWPTRSRKAAAPMQPLRRWRPRTRSWSGLGCRASARTPTTPNTFWSITSSRGSISRHA
jgi:glutamate carboxypeptidase